MSGKQYRLGRLFHPVDGHSVILPVDHGIALGHLDGLRNPVKVVKELSKVMPDAVLLNPGLSQAASDLFYKANAPARILNVDTYYDDGVTIAHGLIGSAEHAVIEGYDAIKILLPWDGTVEQKLANAKIATQIARDSDRWQIPLIIEPTLIHSHDHFDHVVSDAVRVAFEIGADILKVPYPSSKDLLQEWVEMFQIPVVLLGGAKGGNSNSLLLSIKEAMDIGVRGIAIGRNVWQRDLDEAQLLFSKLYRIVHAQLFND
ncbi:MAG: hypothetical protein OWR52_00440 [Acidibacillus sp.]|nr:hypothetical protein [Acidibacillus sp.]